MMSATPVPDADASSTKPARTQHWLSSAVIGGRPGVGPAAARAGLTILSGVYAVGLHSYRALLRIGALPIADAGVPVISVGNLSLGGTGKTSATLAMCRSLLEAGARPAVLSRGHGRRSDAPDIVLVSRGEGPLVGWEQAGDEPCLLASELAGAVVVVGKDRRRTAAQAIEAGANVIVLDDGFQYWRLRKDMEIVLIDCLNPFGGGRLFPRGWLREPVSHLRRADAVWLTHADLVDESTRQAAQASVRRIHPEAPQLLTRHRPVGLRAWPGGEEIGIDALRGRRVLALSSIGSPASFEGLLSALGAEVIPARFPDHHPFSPREVKELAAGMSGQAEIMVITEKDRTRLPVASAGPPMWVLRTEMRRLDGSPLLYAHGAAADGDWAAWVAAACGGNAEEDVSASRH